MAPAAELTALGIAHHRAGRVDQAEACYRAALAADPNDANALQLLGTLASQYGYLDQARRLIRAALAAHPGFAQGYNNLALTDLVAERPAAAAGLLAHALALNPSYAEAWHNHGEAQMNDGSPQAAIADFRTALALNPQLFESRVSESRALKQLDRLADAAQTLSLLVPRIATPAQRRAIRAEQVELDVLVNPPAGLPAKMAPTQRPPGLMSIVVCSIRPDSLARLTANFAAVFAQIPHEVIAITDAASLCEGYNRGIDRARGDVLIFAHDDITLHGPDAADQLFAALAQADIVGPAGARLCVGPRWGQAGPPYLAGQVIQPAKSGAGFEVHSWGLGPTITTGIRVLDGLFIAAWRRVVDKVRFDSQTFDHFHLYDLDFTYAAHLAGFRLAAIHGLGILHDSHGAMDQAWAAQAQRFDMKYQGRLDRPGPRDDKLALKAARFGDLAGAVAFGARLWTALDRA